MIDCILSIRYKDFLFIFNFPKPIFSIFFPQMCQKIPIFLLNSHKISIFMFLRFMTPLSKWYCSSQPQSMVVRILSHPHDHDLWSWGQCWFFATKVYGRQTRILLLWPWFMVARLIFLLATIIYGHKTAVLSLLPLPKIVG